MIHHSKIDWSHCKNEVISADRDDLPENIRAITADKLDGDAIRRAVEICTAPGSKVQVVQIEVPQVADHADMANRMRYESNDEVVFQAYRHPDVIADMRGHFEMVRDTLGFENETATSFIDHLAIMPNAVAQAFGSPSINEILVFGNGQNSIDLYSFHEHTNDDRSPAGRKGFYINHAYADLSTVFLDGAEIGPVSYADTNQNLHFTSDTPTLWHGKPGCYFVFTTAGHMPGPGPSYHSPPIDFGSRTIAITNFHI